MIKHQPYVSALDIKPFTIERVDGQIMLKGADGCWHDLPQEQVIALRDWLNANVGDKVHHRKRGSTYNVLTTAARIQTTKPLNDLDAVTVYIAQDGSTWVRDNDEMNDGRFTNV